MSQLASDQMDRGFNVHDRSGRGGWFPAGRQQRTEVVLIGHGRQAFEHVGEVGFSPKPAKSVSKKAWFIAPYEDSGGPDA